MISYEYKLNIGDKCGHVVQIGFLDWSALFVFFLHILYLKEIE